MKVQLTTNVETLLFLCATESQKKNILRVWFEINNILEEIRLKIDNYEIIEFYQEYDIACITFDLKRLDLKVGELKFSHCAGSKEKKIQIIASVSSTNNLPLMWVDLRSKLSTSFNTETINSLVW